MSSRPLRIVIPGGSGQVGTMLARHFQERGHHVTVLTRSPYTAPWQTVHWDGEQPGLSQVGLSQPGSPQPGSLQPGSWTETLNGADVCINLAGRSVNCRYNRENRREIYDSRIRTTSLLNRVITSLHHPPRVWLNASTATIYRHALDRSMDEATGELGGHELISRTRHAPDTWDFSIRVAKDWEAAFFANSTPRTRKIALRSAIVFSPIPAHTLTTYLNLVRVGLGGTQGNGRQFVSWIHENDFARAIEFLIERDDLSGPINIAAPNPIPNQEFMQALRDAWDMPNGVWLPKPLIELGALIMRTESELVLKSRRVIPSRLLAAGFLFEFRNWSEAADDLVRQSKNRD